MNSEELWQLLRSRASDITRSEEQAHHQALTICLKIMPLISSAIERKVDLNCEIVPVHLFPEVKRELAAVLAELGLSLV